MKKKIKCLLVLIIFLISLFYTMQVSFADELIGMMKVYKITIKLINVDTEDYTIELMDGISNRIYETQEGNKNGEHNFAIATDMDERHLVNYWVRLKFKNGEVKEFPAIKTDKLIDIDEDNNDSSYNYKYNIIVKILPKEVRIGFLVVCILAIIIGFIIWLKKRKRWIK